MNKSARKINRQVAKGSAWMMLFKTSERVLSVISTLVLARLLMPDDFGVVAMAMIVVGFLELMRAFGFDAALITTKTQPMSTTIRPGRST